MNKSKEIYLIFHFYSFKTRLSIMIAYKELFIQVKGIKKVFLYLLCRLDFRFQTKKKIHHSSICQVWVYDIVKRKFYWQLEVIRTCCCSLEKQVKYMIIFFPFLQWRESLKIIFLSLAGVGLVEGDYNNTPMAKKTLTLSILICFICVSFAFCMASRRCYAGLKKLTRV